MKSSIIDVKQLNGFKTGLWIFWGNRAYARNRRESQAIVEGISLLLLTGLSMLFYYYIPFKLLGFIIFVGTASVTLYRPIHLANRAIWLGVLHSIIGTAGLLLAIHFGLTVFGFSIERFLFWGFLLSGVLTLYRWCWNALIWRWLDCIICSCSGEASCAPK